MNRSLKRRQEKLAKTHSAKSKTASDPFLRAMAEAAALFQSGKTREAEVAVRAILAGEAGHADANHLAGILAIQRKDARAAVAHLSLATAARPEHAAMRAHHGVALALAGDLLEAVAAFEAGLKLDTASIEAHNNLAGVLIRLNRHDEAITIYRKAIALKPEQTELHANLANAQLACGRPGDAIESYRDAIALRPRFPEAHYGLAQALRDNGDMAEAAAEYKIAIEQNVNHSNAKLSLSMIADSLEEDRIARLTANYRNALPGSEDRLLLGFALAKAEDARGNFEAASRCLRDANAIQRARIDFRPEKAAADLHAIKAVFTPEFVAARQGMGNMSAAPIFVLGMPRSGTSLIEQILASHRDVNGGGELSQFPAAVFSVFSELGSDGFPNSADKLDTVAIKTVAARYLETVDRGLAAKAHFTDKLPANFLMVGMIRLVFPKARIVHCTREGRDTCLSMFKTFFPSGGHHFSYDMAELAAYYRIYAALMDHWISLFSDTIIDANYERLVLDPETEIRDLLTACDLDFDADCLTFHKTRRVVRTASAAQVRKPIYTSAIGGWKNYAPFFPELTDL